MAYTPKHYYRAKDDLDRGDPNKRVRGSELSDEFEAISSDLRKVRDDLNSEDSAINDIKVDVENNKTEINNLRDDFENHDHALDDLSDVTSKDPQRDDLIVWNGQNWVSTDFAFIETTLRFKGGIDMTGPAPSNPENGDLWVNDNAGTIDASWGEISGREILEGKFVGWAESTGRWHLLGDMANVGVTKVLPATGITVDDSKPSEPVVGLDRDELDKWYADKGDTTDSINDLQEQIDANKEGISDNAGDISTNAGDIADLKNEFENHDHKMDDLSDVNAGAPSRDDLLIWNGSNWVSDDFAFIDTALRFKGGIAPTATAPSNPEGGDLYVFDTNGTVGSSWGAIAGTEVQVGKFVGWAATKGRWYLLGDMASVGVTEVSAGVGISVDDSKPAEPVVSVDRTETDKWYADKGHNHAGVYEPVISPKRSAFNKNFGTTSGTVSEGNHTHSQYLESYTETDPTVPQHVKNISTTNISNWNSAYGWGNHASAGYIKDYTETDPVFKASPAGGITNNDITNWNSVQKGAGGTVSQIKIVVGATGTDPNTLYFVV